MAEGDAGHGRARLSRAEQRFNYAIAVGAVLAVVVLIVISPQVTLDGQRVPVLVFALLVGAFLFGLGQMVVGLTRRRAFLRALDARDGSPSPGLNGGAKGITVPDHTPSNLD